MIKFALITAINALAAVLEIERTFKKKMWEEGEEFVIREALDCLERITSRSIGPF